MRIANFEIVKSTSKYLILHDLGPWDQFPTITNSAEEVVEAMAGQLKPGQRLYYYDSEGECDELKVVNGQFAGFAPGGNEVMKALLEKD